MSQMPDPRPLARSHVYQFLALGLGYPDATVLARMKELLEPLSVSLEVLGEGTGTSIAKDLGAVLKRINSCEHEFGRPGQGRHQQHGRSHHIGQERRHARNRRLRVNEEYLLAFGECLIESLGWECCSGPRRDVRDLLKPEVCEER